MKIKNRDIRALICVSILVGIFLLFRNDGDTNLIKNGKVLNAKTLNWAVGSKSYNLKYEFTFKNEVKVSSNAIEKIRGLKNFENKYFPVIYEDGYGLSQILIDPADFKKYHIPFPDSLKWVMPYFK